MDKISKLQNIYQLLSKLKCECSINELEHLRIEDLTIKQLKYLQVIYETNLLTISKLAKKLDISKPSATLMIKKFEKLEYIYKVSCVKDGRIQYIKLTEKGKKIATVEEYKNEMLVNYLLTNLDSEDIDMLISILWKLK